MCRSVRWRNRICIEYKFPCCPMPVANLQLPILVSNSATYYLFCAIPEVVVVSVLVAGWCKHCLRIKCLIVRCRLRWLNTWKLREISANQTKRKPVFVVEHLSTDRYRTRCLPGAAIEHGAFISLSQVNDVDRRRLWWFMLNIGMGTTTVYL